MVWMGDGTYRLAGSLVTLFRQLEAAYPDREWQTSGGTGTIGDTSHMAEGSASDHNPWLNNTVRAGDFAVTANGPDCEALFQMVNRMYGAHDPRVYPYGYAVFNYRITDWDNPGGYHAQDGDPHTGHCHISVGRTGYDDTDPWPIQGGDDDMSAADVAAINAHTDAKFAALKALIERDAGLIVHGDAKHPNGQDQAMAVLKAIKTKVGA